MPGVPAGAEEERRGYFQWLVEQVGPVSDETVAALGHGPPSALPQHMQERPRSGHVGVLCVSKNFDTVFTF